ncbi:MAG: phosphoserine phosphatase SerB [Pseudomonadales bacterium]|nr:phosphoserine phosphatase SerB [Pseudomonadales bacterium]
MKEVILINIFGLDKPGVTASITDILSSYSINILDIGQAVIHDSLSLGVLAELPDAEVSAPVLKEILFCVHDLGLQVRFEPISAERYSQWVSQQGKPRHIVTLLARKITATQIARVTQIIADYGLNIDDITRLSGRIPLEYQEQNRCASVEFSVRGECEQTLSMRQRFLELSAELGVDIAYQEDTVYRRNRRLVVFDMDSTLIEAEVIDELARSAGVGKQVAMITEQAMQGELDFCESLTRRVALLKGLEESVLEKVADQLRITEGAAKLVSTLKLLGYKTAIISGGFLYFGRRLQQQLGIDYVFANDLEIIDGKLSGRVVGEIVDGKRKAQLLTEIAAREGVNLEQVIAVGDGANDLPMLSIAGLGIAFRAKPIVKASAQHALSTLGLDAILYLLGLSDAQVGLMD